MGEFVCTEMRRVRAGQPVVTGTAEDGTQGCGRPYGLRHEGGRRVAKRSVHGERGIAREPYQLQPGGRISRGTKRATDDIWVLGPAVVHAGARDSMAWLIENGYVGAVFGGNAVAVHDLESALYGTALGMDIEGHTVLGGHRHHMDAINTVRRAGSIAGAVEAVSSRRHHARARHHGVPFCSQAHPR